MQRSEDYLGLILQELPTLTPSLPSLLLLLPYPPSLPPPAPPGSIIGLELSK